MKKSVLALFVVLIASPVSAADPLAENTRAALKKATAYFRSISTNGGYCGIYSLDLKKRYGESLYEKAKSTEIWIQPPGTPSVGQAFLRAYHATGDSYFLDAARAAGRALAWGQSTCGGWDHRANVSHLKPESERPQRKKKYGAFDDNITQGALTFLIHLDEVLDEPWLDDAVALALQFMLDSQFENGAWPQWFPLRGGYHNHYTYNDSAINDCIRVMFFAHQIYHRDKYLRSARRGGDFILASQQPAPQAGWAQQYAHDLKPAWARTFEPPGVCSAVTAHNIHTLVDLYLYTKDEKYLKAIPSAVAWLEKSRLQPGKNLWARLYEVGTNKPIYGDRKDGNKIHYDYDKISEFEKTHYGWRGNYGSAAIAYYQRLKNLGLEKFLAGRDVTLTPEQKKARARQLAPRIQSLIDRLDNRGRWIANNTIRSATFVANANQLCQYLELAK